MAPLSGGHVTSIVCNSYSIMLHAKFNILLRCFYFTNKSVHIWTLCKLQSTFGCVATIQIYSDTSVYKWICGEFLQPIYWRRYRFFSAFVCAPVVALRVLETTCPEVSYDLFSNSYCKIEKCFNFLNFNLKSVVYRLSNLAHLSNLSSKVSYSCCSRLISLCSNQAV